MTTPQEFWLLVAAAVTIIVSLFVEGLRRWWR